MPKVESLSEILAWTPPKVLWTVENVVQYEGRVIMYGEEGIFKSFMSMDAAFKIATGRPWLGHKTVKSPVLYVHIGEVPKVEFRERIMKYMKGNSMTVKDSTDPTNPIENLQFVIDYELSIDTDYGYAVLDNLLKSMKVKPKGLFLDPVFKIMEHDPTETQAMKMFINRVDRLRANYKCFVWLVHHTKKPVYLQDGSTATGTDIMLGSRLLSAWADVLIHADQKDDAGKYSNIMLYMDKPHGGKMRSAIYTPAPITCHVNRDTLQFLPIK